MPTELEINKFIHEHIMGKQVSWAFPDYCSSWSAYGPMLEGKLPDMEKYNLFLSLMYHKSKDGMIEVMKTLHSPSKGSRAIYEFFKEEGK